MVLAISAGERGEAELGGSPRLYMRRGAKLSSMRRPFPRLQFLARRQNAKKGVLSHTHLNSF